MNIRSCTGCTVNLLIAVLLSAALMANAHAASATAAQCTPAAKPGKAPRLFAALGKDRHPALRRALAAGADPNACHEGMTALMLTVVMEDAAAVRLLLDAGALPDRPRDSIGATPLHLAIGMGRYPMAALLLDQGADPGLRDNGGNTMLHSLALQPVPADRAAQLALADRLLQAEVPLDAVNSKGSSALIMAIAANNESLVDWLLSQGANPRIANQQGEDALAYARRLGRAALVARLEQRTPK